MKKTFKRILASLMVTVMILTVAPLSGFVGLELHDFGTIFSTKADAAEYEVGDLITFGSYPQSEVTDTSLLSALNSLSLSWASYGYYSGTGDWDDGMMTSGDYMKYADVTYGGEKYRAVKFTEYRPYCTGYDNDDGTYQDDNGYYTNTVYWFKFEPLEWRVLDPDEGFIMCESIIDSQPYNNTVYYNGSYYYQNTSCTTYANDYATSSIRDWLNDDFYHTAFTEAEKGKIQNSVQDNSCPYNSAYDSDTTYDKIFLLSYYDAINSDYGFSANHSDYDTERRAQGTDYAKAQGLWVSSSSAYYGNSWWWLRSPDNSSYYACGVGSYGYADHYYGVDGTDEGVRPALKFNTSEIHNYEAVITPPTCTEQGYTTYICECGDSYVDDYIPATGHSFLDGVCSCGEETDTPSSIQSITYVQQEDTHKTFTVTCNNRADMIQFIEPDGGTRTYDRYNKNVTITGYKAEGEAVSSMSRDLAYEVWEIYTNLSVGVTVKVRAKFSGKWEADKRSLFVEEYNPIISMELSSISGKKGPVPATVVADAKTEKVMFKMPNNTSVTVAPSATDENGNNIFTGKAWMNEDGLNEIKVLIYRNNVWKQVGTLEYTVE